MEANLRTGWKAEWIELHEGPDEVQEKLKRELSELFKRRDQKEWLDLLASEDTCVGPVNDIEQIFNDPQIIERELFTEMNHPIAGTIKQIGFPIKFSKTPGKLHSHAPILGEHTEEILLQLGYSNENINRFRNIGVIGQNTPAKV